MSTDLFDKKWTELQEGMMARDDSRIITCRNGTSWRMQLITGNTPPPPQATRSWVLNDRDAKSNPRLSVDELAALWAKEAYPGVSHVQVIHASEKMLVFWPVEEQKCDLSDISG